MKPSIVRERFTKKKLLMLFASLVVAVNAGIVAYLCFSSDLTDQQREQPLDWHSNAGLRKAKILADSGTIAGISFMLCAGALLLADKIRSRKK